jgi:hypothetical protein
MQDVMLCLHFVRIFSLSWQLEACERKPEKKHKRDASKETGRHDLASVPARTPPTPTRTSIANVAPEFSGSTDTNSVNTTSDSLDAALHSAFPTPSSAGAAAADPTLTDLRRRTCMPLEAVCGDASLALTSPTSLEGRCGSKRTGTTARRVDPAALRRENVNAPVSENVKDREAQARSEHVPAHNELESGGDPACELPQRGPETPGQCGFKKIPVAVDVKKGVAQLVDVKKGVAQLVDVKKGVVHLSDAKKDVKCAALKLAALFARPAGVQSGSGVAFSRYPQGNSAAMPFDAHVADLRKDVHKVLHGVAAEASVDGVVGTAQSDAECPSGSALEAEGSAQREEQHSAPIDGKSQALSRSPAASTPPAPSHPAEASTASLPLFCERDPFRVELFTPFATLEDAWKGR